MRARTQTRLLLGLGLAALAASATGFAGFMTGFAKQPMAAAVLALVVGVLGLLCLAGARKPGS
jgi:hypothetical protein